MTSYPASGGAAGGRPYTLHHGDCLDVLPSLEADSVDTCITDPPYGLEFMGKDWDHGVPGVAFWREVYRVLKPGAMLLAFGGTRTHHRLMVAIEDAGFEIRDCMMWLYGSGFPKSHDISKAIDKAAGVEREFVGYKNSDRPNSVGNNSQSMGGGPYTRHVKTRPATDAAQQWDGWGTALKPAYEPILLCRKPLTAVPNEGIIQETNVLIGAMLCLLLSSVNSVEKILQSSPSERTLPAFAACLVGAIRTARLLEKSGETDTFNLPETALTCLSIATLWNSTLGGLLNHGNTFTTSTATEVITALRTLNSLILGIMPESIIQALSQVNGSASSVTDADGNSQNGGANGSERIATTVAKIATMKASETGTPANNAASALQLIIPSVASVLSRVQQLTTTPEESELTPNWEPIIVAMKPRDGTFANNALKHGVAGLWIDGGRIGTSKRTPHSPRKENKNGANIELPAQDRTMSGFNGNTGRWPANVILQHTPDCQRVGTRRVGNGNRKGPRDKRDGASLNSWKNSSRGGGNAPDNYGLELVAAWDCHEDCPVRLLDEQSGERPTGGPAKSRPNTTRLFNGLFPTGDVPSEYNGGDTAAASRFFYCAKASKSERTCDGEIENGHPTVKPLDLLRYLCKLTKTPTGGIVLDPFMGSGSTGCAAVLEGRDFIGIELEEEYMEIAERRIEHHARKPRQLELL